VAHIGPPGLRNSRAKSVSDRNPNEARESAISRPFPGRFGLRFASDEFPEKLYRIALQSPHDCDKFNQVNAAFAALIFGDERLRFPELFSQDLLPDVGLLPHCDKHRNEAVIFRGFQGLLHAPPSLRIGGAQSDPRKGLSQNWILGAVQAISAGVTPHRRRQMAVTASTVRYIKLGRNGIWERAALDGGEVHFGLRDAPHDIMLTGDFGAIRQHSINQGRGEAAATRDAREAEDFYKLDETCLWITFAREHMWWSFALPEVIWVGGDGTKHGERTRKTIGGWSNTDVNGKPLKINSLSTRLTKVAGYRRTICKIEAQDYLLRRINGVEEPIVAKCLKAREVMLNLTIEAIQSLHWKDFETLVDIIFSRSGWNRVSALGGTQKLIDIELEQPITEERAAIQVKSDASQKTLEDYVASTDAAGQFSRFFFVCHSPIGKLAAPEGRDNVHVWTGKKLAEAVLRTGLHDWVLEKIVQS
jgi:hypothetical protein